MVRAKVCGTRCHNAETIRCKCWCMGVFHGVNNTYNRKNYKKMIERMGPRVVGDLAVGKIKYKGVTKNVNAEHKMS